MRLGHGVAYLVAQAIGVFVAYALIHGAVAVSTAAFHAVHAHSTELFSARRIAAVARGCIAVVASFAGFNDRIAATEWNTCMRIRAQIAALAHLAIDIFIAYALIYGAVAISTAAFGGVHARLTKLFRTGRIAAVTRRCIAVVAALIGFDNPIAAAGRNACIGCAARPANFAHDAIRILVASTNVHIAQTARA